MSSNKMFRTARLFALALPLLGACGDGSILDPSYVDDPTPGGNNPGGNNPGGNNPGGNNPGGNNPGGNDPGGSNQPPAPTAQVACPADRRESFGRRSLRRLTARELDSTVRAVFGLEPGQWAGPQVPPDPASIDGFNNNVDRLLVTPDYARGALETARAVAGVITTDAQLTRLLPCATSGGPPCAQTFIQSFGPKLYRRPLSPAEQARYLALYDKVAKDGEFKSFVYWATATMLQSPNVIYRSELGEPDGNGRFKLTQYEIATAQAYTFTGGPPTPELYQAAAGGRLATADQLETAARSLVLDAAQKPKPAFRNVLLRFADEWLALSNLDNVQKDTALFPGFSTEIQDAMGEEMRRFITGVVLDERGTPTNLLTAPYTFVDTKLAHFYGWAAVAGDYQKVTRPANWGAGLLSLGGLLTLEAHNQATSPTKRGYTVRTRIMCGTLPPPPMDVDPIPEPSAELTTRQRYEMVHMKEPSCSGCHKLMDPIGFAFERLDAVGRYREREGIHEIDDRGEVLNADGSSVTFKGPSEAATAIAKLPETSDCVASYLAAYALGVSRENASCLVQGAVNELRGGSNLLDFYIRMARSEHFRTRLP